MKNSQDIDIKNLATLSVLDGQGKGHSIATFWQEQRAAMVFVRHFGWVFCRQQVADLAGYQQRFTDINAELIIVGNGQPVDLPGFSELTGYNGKLFTDPTLKSFKALGFTRKVSGLFAASALVGGLKALKDGYRPGTMQGDALQLGGAVVVGPGAQLYYYFRAQQAADHAPVKAILDSCGDNHPPTAKSDSNQHYPK